MQGLTYIFKAALRRHMVTTSGLMLVALAALVPAHAQTSVQNTATVALPPGSPVVDSNAANNTSSVTVGVLALPRLTLVKQVVNDNGGTAAATGRDGALDDDFGYYRRGGRYQRSSPRRDLCPVGDGWTRGLHRQHLELRQEWRRGGIREQHQSGRQ